MTRTSPGPTTPNKINKLLLDNSTHGMSDNANRTPQPRQPDGPPIMHPHLQPTPSILNLIENNP